MFIVYNTYTMDNTQQTTTDHETIKQWVTDRNGTPAVVESDDTDTSILRIKFEDSDDLDEINWEHFFELFEQNNLTFLYQKKTADGEQSRFCKFIERDN